jgi:hypothetical protein
MIWVIFVAGAVLSWGVYGALLHMGQRQLGNPRKAMLCVGAAYFLIGVILPVASLGAQGNLSAFNVNGLVSATVAGALGLPAPPSSSAFHYDDLASLLRSPLVFGSAPIVNVLVDDDSPAARRPSNPILYVGFLRSVSLAPGWCCISGRLRKRSGQQRRGG